MRRKTGNGIWIYGVAIILLVSSLIMACMIGSSDVSIKSVIYILLNQIFGVEHDFIRQADIYIIWNLRLPRAILAFAVGGGLAVAGAAMQSVTRNVMADPYVLGVSSGALACVSIGYLVGGILTTTRWFIPVLAFSGAIGSLLLVFAIGGFAKTASPSKLVLSGMAISTTLNAVAQYCIYNTQGTNNANSIVAWMMGSLASARWDNIVIPILGCLLGGICFISKARAFDLIALGDETAISLGTNTTKIKRLALILVAAIAGLAVASCGMIGLVGFVIPHIVRFLAGTEHRKLFPLTILIGGIFLIWMDICARTLLAPQEIPIGIFTSLVGGPYFIWMLRRKARRK